MTEHRVCRVDDLAEHEVRSFHAGPRELVLCLLDGRVCALSAECTHEALPLAGGGVDDGVVTCPWHGARYDLRTGAVRGLPAVRPLRAFSARVDDTGVVFVDPDA